MANESSPSEQRPLIGNGSSPLAKPESSRFKLAFTKNWAYVLCLSCCLVAGAAPLFSIYTPTLQRKLGYTQLEINAIAIALEAGQYLPLPIIGYFSDKYGQSKLGLLAATLLFPAHLIAAYTAQTKGSYRVLAGCFGAIGTGLGSLFFCGLISCARLFPDSTLLSISAPTTAFGLSALWEAQVIRLKFINSETGEVLLDKLFFVSAFFFLFFGISGFFSAKIAGVDHSEHRPKDQTEGENGEDEQEGYGTTDDREVEENEHADASTAHDALPQKHRLLKFLYSKHTWVLLLCFLLSSGPLEMYLNNMGAIMDTIHSGPDVPLNVSLTALASTAARLIIGLLSDIVQPLISRPVQLAIMLVVSAVSHILLATGFFAVDHGRFFFLSSLINGFSYGVTFTLFPAIVAAVWGLKSFGTNWGTFVVAPAIGSFFYGILFASIYDHALEEDPSPEHDRICTRGTICYQGTFLVTASSFIAAALLLVLLARVSWRGKFRKL